MKDQKVKIQSDKLLIGYGIVLSLFSLVGFASYLRLDLEGSGSLIFIGFLFFMASAFYLVKKGFDVLGKYIIIVLPAYFLLVTSIYFKSHGFMNSQLLYLLPRILVLFLTMGPIMFFGIKYRKDMIFTLILMFPAVFLFDVIHQGFGIEVQNLSYDHSYYSFFKLAMVIVYCVPLVSILLAQKTSTLFKLQLTEGNKRILKEKEKVEKLNEKLQFQANLHSVLDITSKEGGLDEILKKVLEEVLMIETLNVDKKGAIFVKGLNGEFRVAAERNCKGLDSICNEGILNDTIYGKVINEADSLFCDKCQNVNVASIINSRHIAQYVVPCLDGEEVLGLLNVYVLPGQFKDNNVLKYLEAIADILVRKIREDIQREELKNTNKQIISQQIALSATHKELTDSVNYAKLLQNSLLPNKETLNNCFQEASVLFIPKDKISGDFYFTYDFDDYMYFGVGDCTGHGIPGAFLAAMSVEAIKTVIHEEVGIGPNLIADKLREIAKIRFDLNVSESRSDAMDAAFCMYDKKKGKLYFSGGFINMVIIRNGEIIEVASDKCPIGAYPIENPFTLNEFQLEEDDVISLYSDGYVDQFGYDKTSTRKKPTKFKRKRLQALLLEINHLSCDEQVERLRENLTDWMSNLDQIDDITVFLARHIK